MIDKKIIKKILNSLGVADPILLGKGGEGEVYELDNKTVVKIYGDADFDYLESLKTFQSKLLKYNFSFDVPEIFEIRQLDNRIFTVEKKLNGICGDKLFENLDDSGRKQLLSNFLDGVDEIARVELNDLDYGQIINGKDRIAEDKWSVYLVKKMYQRLSKSKEQLIKDVSDLDNKVKLLESVFTKELISCPKNLVHHDYYLNNVLMTKDLKLSSVLDFSPHTVVGDWRMDVAGAVTFLGINNVAKEYIPYMRALVENKYGVDILKIIDLYLLYYSIYYSDTYEFDSVSYDWCVENLNNERLWRVVGY